MHVDDSADTLKECVEEMFLEFRLANKSRRQRIASFLQNPRGFIVNVLKKHLRPQQQGYSHDYNDQDSSVTDFFGGKKKRKTSSQSTKYVSAIAMHAQKAINDGDYELADRLLQVLGQPPITQAPAQPKPPKVKKK